MSWTHDIALGAKPRNHSATFTRSAMTADTSLAIARFAYLTNSKNDTTNSNASVSNTRAANAKFVNITNVWPLLSFITPIRQKKISSYLVGVSVVIGMKYTLN